MIQDEPTRAEIVSAYQYLLNCKEEEFAVIAEHIQLFTPAYREALEIINGVDKEDVTPDISGFD